ncbi:hypothetical protein E1301_Tti023691 [Triplophysa tibetana]|uniref:Uncharacterized protein n=1 Tax=Triplophysa tibetana TaxID=1572043 RepID=A0A5A9P790_9TELE|nr:hypothetical protein E1301_Tti023691 [Triplophysa tibetana]
MASKMKTPYDRMEPIRMRCVGLRKSQRTLGYIEVEGATIPDKIHITTLAALWDGK